MFLVPGGLIILLIHGYKVLEPACMENKDIAHRQMSMPGNKAHFDIGSFKLIIDGGKAWQKRKQPLRVQASWWSAAESAD
jgi:hypothetical protein